MPKRGAITADNSSDSVPFWQDIGSGSEVGFWPAAHATHAEWFSQLLDVVEWQQHSVIIFGKRQALVVCLRLCIPDYQPGASLPTEHDHVFQMQCSPLVFSIPQPRLVAYFATDPEAVGPYTYSGLTLYPVRMSEVPGMEEAMELVGSLAGICGPDGAFNSCLANLYRDGSDHMGWHSDNEKL